MKLTIRFFAWCVVWTAVASWMATGQARAAAGDSAADRQGELLRVLQSDAPPADKAITCKKLAIYGGKDVVPALAALLSNEDLASWARIGLEAIPDPAADAALREAMGRLQGKLLIGVINSIGVRRDANAVGGLVDKLKHPDAGVASAAAEALGHIGGSAAAKALHGYLAGAPEGVRSSVAEGCVLCAEKFLAEGKTAEAVQLYDAVRAAEVPKQRVLEATRGAILARGSAGIPLLLEQLRSWDRGLFHIGLRTARELAGQDVTEALAAELSRSRPERQALLLQAVADRQDAAVLPAVLEVARSGRRELRIVAVGILERLGNRSCVPVLLDAAAQDDAQLAQAAKAALVKLGGKEVEADLVARLPESSGKTRLVLIELAGQRRLGGALPVVMQCVEDEDPGIRRAAVGTMGVLGDEKQAAELVGVLQKTQNARDREEIEKALQAIGGRRGAQCVPHFVPLARHSDSDLRMIALHLLASVGGSEALAAVKTAVDDRDEAVRDEAVSVLSTWPNNWPEDAGVAEPLLALAKSGQKMSYRVQGVRGYLRYVQEDKKLKDSEKLDKVNALLPLLERPEEKRLAIAVISTLPTAGVLELLMTFAADRALAEEACLGIVKLLAGDSLKAMPKEVRQKALQTVVEKSENAATRKRAEEALKRIR